MDEADLSRVEETARALALAAGRAIMEIYRADGLATRAKPDDSPVTEADLAADRLIAAGLAEAHPEIPAVTEEQAESHARTAPARFFLVDPLDGTKDFIKHRGEFTVNIALIEHARPVAGVVYAPARGRLFRTVAGRGAVEERIAPDGVAEPDSARAIGVATPDNAALTVVASKSHRDAATDAYIAQYSVAEFTSAGSSLKFCLVASGEADLYPRLGRTMEWDTAAGHAVLSAAGGAVVAFDTHAPLAYGKPGWENPFFLAHAPGVALAEPA